MEGHADDGYSSQEMLYFPRLSRCQGPRSGHRQLSSARRTVCFPAAQTTVTLEERCVSSLAQTDALAKLFIEKGIITQHEFLQKISEERGTYQRMFNPIPQ
jgi:hypothetical protein